MTLRDQVSVAEWLLAQCHREDAVGLVARRWVEQTAGQAKADAGEWLANLSSGANWQIPVATVKEEYETCLCLLLAGKTAETYPALFASQAYREALEQSSAKHRREPSITPDAYLRGKQFALQKALQGRKIVYLDTNHWVNLRHVVLGSRLAKPVYGEILEALNGLCQRGRIVCPVSFPLFLELMKQSDERTRLPMARLMDCFSGGICAQAPVELERLEIRQMILRAVLRESAPDLREWIWTKVGYLGGIRFPVHGSFSSEDSVFIQKVSIDAMWGLTLEHLAEMNPSTMPPSSLPGAADATNADAAWCRSANLPFDKVFEQEKAYLLHLLKDDLIQIAKEVSNEHPNRCNASAMPYEPGKGPDP